MAREACGKSLLIQFAVASSIERMESLLQFCYGEALIVNQL